MRTQSTRPAELDVRVELREVDRGGAVRAARVLHHRLVAVLALVVPGEIDEGHRQRLLSRRGEQLPNRLHRRIVLLRKRLHARRARHGPRMLPEIEVVLPVPGRRQHLVHHAHLHVADRITTRLGIRGDLNLDDLRSLRLRVPFHAILGNQTFRRLRLRGVFHVARHARLHDEARGHRPHGLSRRQPRAHRLAAPRGQFNRPCGEHAAHSGERHQQSIHISVPLVVSIP